MQEQTFMRGRVIGREDRRAFIKRAAFVVATLPTLSLGACTRRSEAAHGQTSPQNWQGAADAPANTTWRTVITKAGEPGESLLMSGRIFQPDGVTPARGVLLFVYHTDATGYYNQPNRLPARLRGWMRTGADGRYEFRTIKPAPYPGRDFPAHIHATLSAPAYPEDWIDDYWFTGDPLITSAKRATLTGRGGFNSIVALTRTDGVWHGQRDIRLGHV